MESQELEALKAQNQMLLDQNKQFQESHKKLQEQASQILSDPAVTQILSLRQAGKQFEIAEPKNEDPFADKDPDELTPKDLVKLVKQTVDQSVKSLIPQLVKPVEDRVNTLTKRDHERINQEIARQIVEARKEYEDFDKYIEPMKTISNDNPTLEPKELYFLAKMRSGGLTKTPPKTPSSEKPTQEPTAASVTKKSLQEMLVDAAAKSLAKNGA